MRGVHQQLNPSGLHFFLSVGATTAFGMCSHAITTERSAQTASSSMPVVDVDNYGESIAITLSITINLWSSVFV